MDQAIFMLGIGLLGGMAGVLLGSVIFGARFNRRITTLEWALGDLQDRASTFKGREMAEKRWTKEKSMEAELAQVLQTAPASRRRYDNDPLGE